MTSFESKCSTCGAEYPYRKTLSISSNGDGTYEANLYLFESDEPIQFVAGTSMPRQAGGRRVGMFVLPPTTMSPPLSPGRPGSRSPSPSRSRAVVSPPVARKPEVEIHAYMGTDVFEMLTPAKARAIASAWNDIAYVGDLLVNSYPNVPQELEPFLE